MKVSRKLFGSLFLYTLVHEAAAGMNVKRATSILHGQAPQDNTNDDSLPITLPDDLSDREARHFLRGLAVQGPNLDVNAGEDAYAEVSIDINPTNPDNMVICGHDSNSEDINTFYTMDGGNTWTAVPIDHTQDGFSNIDSRFDPSMVFADNASVFVGYEAETPVPAPGVGNQVTVVVCRSTDGGASYGHCSSVDTDPGNDKLMMATGPDPVDPNQENIYIAWKRNVVNSSGVKSHSILISRSSVNVLNFSRPLVIYEGGSPGAYVWNSFPHPSVGPNGEVYVSWWKIFKREVVLSRSFDGAQTFDTDKVIATSSTGHSAPIPAQPDRGVFVGPVIDVDRSGRDYNGRIYLIYTDVGSGGGNDIDILAKWSGDEGDTWSNPIRVNDDLQTMAMPHPYKGEALFQYLHDLKDAEEFKKAVHEMPQGTLKKEAGVRGKKMATGSRASEWLIALSERFGRKENGNLDGEVHKGLEHAFDFKKDGARKHIQKCGGTNSKAPKQWQRRPRDEEPQWQQQTDEAESVLFLEEAVAAAATAEFNDMDTVGTTGSSNTNAPNETALATPKHDDAENEGLLAKLKQENEMLQAKNKRLEEAAGISEHTKASITAKLYERFSAIEKVLHALAHKDSLETEESIHQLEVLHDDERALEIQADMDANEKAYRKLKRNAKATEALLLALKIETGSLSYTAHMIGRLWDVRGTTNTTKYAAGTLTDSDDKEVAESFSLQFQDAAAAMACPSLSSNVDDRATPERTSLPETERAKGDDESEQKERPFKRIKYTHGVSSLEPPDPRALRRRRCGKCVMCSKQDCGLCKTCVANARSTTLYKQECLKKMCIGLTEAEKAQPIQGLPGWSFFFTNPKDLDWQPVHSKLTGLCILDPTRTKRFCSIESAASAHKGFEEEEAEKCARDLYEKTLGLQLRRSVKHCLIGKGFCQDWTDVLGTPKTIYGTVVKCEQCYFDASTRFFTVEYSKSSMSIHQGVAIPQVHTLTQEEMVWGGCLLFLSKTAQTQTSAGLSTIPYRTKWIVPEERVVRDEGDGPPCLVLTYRGFMLKFQAKKSTIPGAGLGFFVRCSPLFNQDQGPKDFKLNKGELLDLGLYAPLREEDWKPNHIMVVKDFIYGGECEGWSFNVSDEHKEKLKEVFDITDDLTGDLHGLARQNVLCYANETDGEEPPSLRAEHDPEGSVHYLLGNTQGTFCLPSSSDVELKIDYGKHYESVRVRKGYPRCSGEEREKLEAGIQNADEETLKDFLQWSASDVGDTLCFLESLFGSKERSVDLRVAERCLVVAMQLYNRLSDIEVEFSQVNVNDDDASFCDCGYSSLEDLKTVQRTKDLILLICRQFGDATNLKTALLSADLYMIVLVKFFGVGTPGEVLRALEAADLRGMIESPLLHFERPEEPKSRRCERIPMRQLQEQYKRDCMKYQQTRKIVVSSVSTYQGRIGASTNGCTVISALVAATHLASHGGVTDTQIVQVIDRQCGPILRVIRGKLGLDGHAFIIPSDVHDHLVDRKILKQKDFIGAAGGNIVDPDHIGEFIKLLSVGKDGKGASRKAAATLFFREHVISIVKCPVGQNQSFFDLVDSLPNMSNGGMATRTRCSNVESLEVLLRWYASRKFSDSNCSHIDRNAWDDSLADFDPRVFQGFVWATS